MNEEQQKRTEDALEWLQKNVSLELAKDIAILDRGNMKNWIWVVNQIGYDIWVIRGSGRINDRFKWIGYFAKCNSFDKWATDEFDDFDEAMLEALISSVYDKFPKKEGE